MIHLRGLSFKSTADQKAISKKLLIEAFLQEIVVYNDFFDVFFRTIPAPESAKRSATTGGDEACQIQHYRFTREALKKWIKSLRLKNP